MKPTQTEVNVFLDFLRSTGTVNMFGAVPFVQKAFGITKQEARALTFKWMETFSARLEKGEVLEVKQNAD